MRNKRREERHKGIQSEIGSSITNKVEERREKEGKKEKKLVHGHGRR